MEPTPEQIKSRYTNLLAKSQRERNKSRVGGILIFSSVLIFISISGISSTYNLGLFQSSENPTEYNRTNSAIFGGIILAIMLSGLVLIPKSNKIIFDKQQKIFFEFYHTYVILKKYVDIKKKKEQKNAIQRIDGFIYYIGNWADKRAPDPISGLPQYIQSNLTEKIHPRIKQGKTNELQEFIENIHNFACKVYEKQPTESQLLKLNGFLNTMNPIPEIKPSKIIEPFEKRSFVTPAIVSSVITIILIGVLINSKTDWGQIVLGSIGIAVVIFFGLHKRKS